MTGATMDFDMLGDDLEALGLSEAGDGGAAERQCRALSGLVRASKPGDRRPAAKRGSPLLKRTLTEILAVKV